jgi:hypothetical protein
VGAVLPHRLAQPNITARPGNDSRLGRYEVQPGVLTAFLDRPQLRPHHLDRIG